MRWSGTRVDVAGLLPILSTGLAVLAAAQALAYVDVARLHQSRVVHDAVHGCLGRDSRQRRALSEISAVRDPRRAEAGLLQHARARREAGAAGPARAGGRPSLRGQSPRLRRPQDKGHTGATRVPRLQAPHRAHHGGAAPSAHTPRPSSKPMLAGPTKPSSPT